MRAPAAPTGSIDTWLRVGVGFAGILLFSAAGMFRMSTDFPDALYALVVGVALASLAFAVLLARSEGET